MKVSIPMGLARNILEAIKASELYCQMGKLPDKTSADYLGTLRDRLETLIVEAKRGKQR